MSEVTNMDKEVVVRCDEIAMDSVKQALVNDADVDPYM